MAIDIFPLVGVIIIMSKLEHQICIFKNMDMVERKPHALYDIVFRGPLVNIF